MRIGKVVAQVFYTSEMIVKSRFARHMAVNFIVAAGTAYLGRSIEREGEASGEKRYPNEINLWIAGILASYAINNALDAILEDKDEEIFRNYDQKMKELELKFPTEK